MLDKLRLSLHNSAPIFLRFGIGLVFVLFAYHKLGVPGQGVSEIKGILEFLDIGTSSALNYSLGVIELIVGLGLIFGAYIKWVAPLGGLLILGFFASLILKYGLTQDPTLYRDLGLVGGLLALWIMGSGPLSVDTWLEKKKSLPIN